MGLGGGYVTEVCHITLHCFLQFNVTDSERWQLDPCADYMVRDAYQLLTSQDTSLITRRI